MHGAGSYYITANCYYGYHIVLVMDIILPIDEARSYLNAKYDCEAIVKADALPQGAEASPIDLEQLLITMVKGEKTDDGTSL